MENNIKYLTLNDLKFFDFSKIIKYMIHKSNGLAEGYSSIHMFDGNIEYVIRCSRNLSLIDLHNYVPILDKFYHTKNVAGHKHKYYIFDKNKNKPYNLGGWKITIIPEITISKL